MVDDNSLSHVTCFILIYAQSIVGFDMTIRIDPYIISIAVHISVNFPDSVLW